MSEMVERVARAMYDAIELKRPWEHPEAQRVWGDCTRLQARAAIAAMREPTEAMLDGAARDELLHDRMGGRPDEGRLPKAKVIARLWSHMIDQALR